jgi:ankyrin repeat protein
METASFIEAIREGNIKQVEEMLDRDPGYLQTPVSGGTSPVLTAIYYGENAIAELLIERGAPLNLFEAAASGRIGRVRVLLDEDASLANAYAPDGFQPLGLASFFGHLPVVELLLERGAAVNSPSNNAQHVMPLHSAVAGRHYEIAKMLLEHGAEANAAQADGFRPLHGAAENGQREMIELLLNYGADKALAQAQGETALDIAVKRSQGEDILSLLR